MHARGTGGDHGGHEFVGVERPAESGLGIRDDRRQPFALRQPFGCLDLVRPEQRVVDAPHDVRNGVGGVEALVGVGLAAEVGVGGDLPAREVDGLEAGAHLLHGLVAGEGAEGGHPFLGVEELPEAFGAAPGEGVLFLHPSAEGDDIFGAVVALDAVPAGIRLPGGLEFCRGLGLVSGSVRHGGSSAVELLSEFDYPGTARILDPDFRQKFLPSSVFLKNRR